MPNLSLQVIDGEFVIHRLDVGSDLPASVLDSKIFFISKTDEELSVVCFSDIDLDSQKSEADWRCIKVMGPLDFNLTGILSALAQTLAQAQISIFAVSTFDTDYILVKSNHLTRAKETLKKAGYNFK